MTDVFSFCPRPPDWRLDWAGVDAAFAWVRDLAGCVQDAVNHAEGDVWTHVRMVAEALAELPAWRDLPGAEREVVFAAVLLHDVAKPECRREEPGGHVSFRGHSRRGAVRARQILWHMSAPFAAREQVAALVRFHQTPFFFIERDDAERLALEVSQSARCDHLAILAEADARGRVCRDRRRLLDNIALFTEGCRELGCLSAPYRFPSDHTRFLYFRRPGRHPAAPAHEDCRCDVVLMSGLPGAGKDHHVRTRLADRPVISLDALREELDVDPAGAQGVVIQQARERGREYLRKGTSFVWNGTNLSRQLRRTCLQLFADYNARVHVAYVEAGPDRLREQNRNRPGAVPPQVIERLLDRWEVPDLTEAHTVEYVVRD